MLVTGAACIAICVGEQTEACNISLFSALGVFSPALAQTAFQHHGARLCCRPAGSFHPLLPLTLPENGKRDVSAGLTSKERGKEKRKSFDVPQTTLVESLQRQTCKDSCKRQPLRSSQCNSLPPSVSKTQSILKPFAFICLWPQRCCVFLHKQEQTSSVLAFRCFVIAHFRWCVMSEVPSLKMSHCWNAVQQ